MKKFSSSPRTRLRQLRSLTPTERKAVLRHVTAGVPIRPWPCGMPSSPVPHVVVLGVSPGNSPSADDRDVDTYRKGENGLSFTEASRFDYKDGRHYWNKVGDLCTFLINRDSPGIQKVDAADLSSLSSHLNLGTRRLGVAGLDAVEDDIIQWVSTLLYSKFQAKILVGFGLTRILPLKNEIWNKGGLQLDWSSPDDTEPFEGYKFRFWRATRKDGRHMAVLLWPNHPSRHPFSGDASSPHWHAAKKCADNLLKRNKF